MYLPCRIIKSVLITQFELVLQQLAYRIQTVAEYSGLDRKSFMSCVDPILKDNLFDFTNFLDMTKLDLAQPNVCRNHQNEQYEVYH